MANLLKIQLPKSKNNIQQFGFKLYGSLHLFLVLEQISIASAKRKILYSKYYRTAFCINTQMQPICHHYNST